MGFFWRTPPRRAADGHEDPNRLLVRMYIRRQESRRRRGRNCIPNALMLGLGHAREPLSQVPAHAAIALEGWHRTCRWKLRGFRIAPMRN